MALWGYFISNDDDNSTKLLLFISPLPQIVLDERNPFGGLAPERARLEKLYIFNVGISKGASQ